ncbi:MAG: BON domain-containing protein [Chloroflexota bacterium]
MKRERRASRRRVEEDEEERTVGEILRDLQTEVGLQGALLSIAPSTGLRVDVDAEEGMVYLRGEVASEEQKVEAERIVRSLLPRGVKGIRNELVVNPDISHLPHP